MSDVGKVGIFLPNWLGDLTMATPTLRALRRRFPRPCRLIGILRPNLADLLAGTDWLDDQWCFHPYAKQDDQGQRALIRRMRRERLDVVLLLTNSIRTGLLAWLGGAKQRIGYARNARGMFLTTRLSPPRQGRRIAPEPVVRTYLALAEAAGCPPESPRLELALTDEERDRGARLWHALGARDDGRVIAVNSSGAYGAAKLWPSEHFASLAQRIVDRTDHDVLVLCGPNERDIARDIANRADRARVFTLAEQELGLGLTKAALARCRALVSTDSGPRHVGAALGMPVVTVMGPTLPIWIENPTIRGALVHTDIECLGCAKRVCPLRHHRCMWELAPETVFARLVEVLDSFGDTRS